MASHELSVEEEIPYSVLTSTEKKIIVFLCSTIGLWSTLSMPIYFPILPVIKLKFHTTDEMMNLAVVLYLILQGLSPTISGNLADLIGRRPMIMISLVLYIGANIGLALADTYWLILFLRCIQAAGIAPVIAINSGIVGDITKRHERGSFMGVVAGIQLVGQGFGALIGAALASSLGWRSIFWFLAIAVGVELIVVVICLPETRRTIVGNLSVRPISIINTAPILLTPRFRKRLSLNQRESLEPKTVSNFNILLPFIMLTYPEVYTCLFSTAIMFTTWTMALTTFTTMLTDNYHYGTMTVGLCYLPSGIGALAGALLSGRVLDFSYKRMKTKYDQINDTQKPDFNIIKARCGFYYYPCSAYVLFLLVFAWTLDYKVHISVPMIASFFVAFSCMFPMTMAQTVLVDIFPTKSSTSTSILNLTRCWVGAIFIACVSKMMLSMTVGGCYTFMAALCLLTNVLIYILIKKGGDWIQDREFKEKEQDKN